MSSSTADSFEAGSSSNPKKRRFVEYRLEREPDHGSHYISETYEEWDASVGTYRQKTVRTDIVLPQSALDLLAAELPDDYRRQIADYCGQLRRGLDRDGVKVYFDIPKNLDEDQTVLRAKWSYFFDGHRIDEPIPAEILPVVSEMVVVCETGKALWPLAERDSGQVVSDAEICAAGFPPEAVPAARQQLQAIMEMRRKYGSCRYYETKEWKNWYGRAMQAKRERLIGTRLEKRVFESRWAADVAGGERQALYEIALDTAASAARDQVLRDISDQLRTMLCSVPLPECHCANKVQSFTPFAESFARLYCTRHEVPESARPTADDVAKMVPALVDELQSGPTESGTEDRCLTGGWQVVLALPAADDQVMLRSTFVRIVRHIIQTIENQIPDFSADAAAIDVVAAKVAELAVTMKNSPTAERFRTSVAGYDAVSGTLRVKDMTRLGVLVRKLYFETAAVTSSAARALV